jgi:GNAT superfamily N-acetyltransferase
MLNSKGELLMKQLTFENIYTLGNVIVENNQYRHFHYPEMLIRYDSNFIEFKNLPSVNEFEKAANYLREFHLKYGQKHVKFYFLANERLTEELFEYMDKLGYEIGFTELYSILPDQFPLVKNNPDIEIEVVTDKNFETFLKIQYQQDLEFGSEFANQKINLHKRHFEEPNIQQLLAFYKGIPTGSVEVIITDNTAEIDSLFVDESFQKKGIGSRLQKFVMDTYPTKVVILVADGEDKPREMYRRQNYQYLGFKYGAHKVYES